MKEFIAKLRKDYRLGELNESQVDTNPIHQFEKWFADAVNADAIEPNAMVISTVDENSRPHSRIVLLRNVDQQGFVFYTNYASSKGLQIEANPHVCLNFFWVEIERQVRIEGTASRITQVESNEYFQSRPKGNQLSALASPQSRVISGRQELESRMQELEATYRNQDTVERPEYWGGYRIKPEMMEFWQGRVNRLHDRIRYRLTDGNSWEMERLAP